MKIGFILNGDDNVNNFSLAEAVYAECLRDDFPLNAEVVAKMILLQVDARKGGE